MLDIKKISVESMVSPMGLDEKTPRFSFILSTQGEEVNGVYQSRRRIVVSEFFHEEKSPLWDSGWVDTEESVLISYAGPDLNPKTRYKIQIEVEDNRGESCSGESFWETGFMDTAWTGKWISYEYKESEEYNPSPMLRSDFTLTQGVRQARLYVTARGLY